MKRTLGAVTLLLVSWSGMAAPVEAQLEISRPSTDKTGPLVENARTVLAALVKAAERNQQQPLPLKDDRLTEYYFREAAAAARKLPPKEAADAFLVALGIGLDETDLMRRNPVTRDLWTRVEPEADRQRRLRVLGDPTMHDRHDSAQHFTVSCALTAFMGPQLAESAGIMKEQLDMRPGGSGFSFHDLCADFAGIAFANQVRASEKMLAAVEKSFRVADYLPSFAGLREDFSLEAFTKEYGSTKDERFRKELAGVWKRVRDLPVHKKK